MPEPIVNLRDSNGNTKAYLDYDSSTGELIVKHTDSGEDWTYNPNSSAWEGNAANVGDVSVGASGVSDATSDGVWCWFQDPRAVSDGSTTWAGYITQAGDIEIAEIDESTESVTTRTTLHTALEQDDHASPAILLREDGHLMVFYSAHSGDPIYYRTSTNPKDASAFDIEQSISPNASNNHTYMNPRQRSSDGRIYLFYRGVDDLDYVYSDDKGSTWSAEQELINANTAPRVYFKIGESENGRMDIGVSRQADGSNGTTGNMEDARHCYFDGGSLYDAAGNSLGTLPIDSTNVPLVYDSSAAGNYNAWINDCRTDGTTPEMVFVAYPAEDDHRHYYARYDSGSWAVEEIAPAGQYITTGLNGQEYYNPGLVLDHTQQGVVYAGHGDYHAGKIARWKRENGEWYATEWAGGDRQNFRPVSPWGHDGSIPVMWNRGEYAYYSNDSYSCGVAFGKDTAPGHASIGGERLGGAWAVKTSTQSVSSATTTTVTLEDAKSAGVFGTVNNRGELDAANDQIVVSRTGLYLVGFAVQYDALSAAGNVRTYLNVNGSTTGRAGASGNAGDRVQAAGFLPVPMAAGWPVSLQTRHDTGGPETVMDQDGATYLWVIQIV